MNNWIVVFFIDYAKWYSIDIYDFDLNWLNKESIPRIDFCDYEFIVPNVERTGLFSKSCLLKDNYAFFIYYLKEDEWSLKFKVYQINSVTSYVEKLAKNFWDYSGYEYKLNVEIRLNELVRINHERLAFIALPSYSMNWIYIFLFDFFDNYCSVKIREYHENFDNKYQLQLE